MSIQLGSDFGLRASGFGLRPAIAWSLRPGANRFEYPTHSFDEVVHDSIRCQTIGRAMLLIGAIPGSHQDAMAPDISRQRHVHPPIADREGFSAVHTKFANRPIHQSSAWFAAVALDGV